jgi:hypothetical protein
MDQIVVTKRLTPVGFATLQHIRKEKSTCYPRLTGPCTCRFQGLITLLTVYSSPILWTIFRAQAFMGFTLQSFFPSKKPRFFQNALLSCPSHNHAWPCIKLSGASERLFLLESRTRKPAVKRVRSLYSPGFLVSEVLLHLSPSMLLQAATSYALKRNRKR